MKSIFLLFLLGFQALVGAEPKDPDVSAVTEGEPSWNLCKSVNAITGDLYITEEDLTINAVQPIHFSRNYISGNGKGAYGGWSFLSHIKLMLVKAEDHRNIIYVADPNSSRVGYRQQSAKSSCFNLDIEQHGDGITNCSRGILSGRTNLKNQRLEWISKRKIHMHSCDGTLRVYTCNEDINPLKSPFVVIPFHLEAERHPNGNWTTYQYDKQDRVTFIQTHNPHRTKVYAWAQFHYHKKPAKYADFHIDTSDGRKLYYRFQELGKTEKQFYLTHVTSSYSPEEQEDYCSAHTRRGPLVKKRIFPNGREMYAHYYDPGKNNVGTDRVRVHDEYDPVCDRVKTLAFPVGSDSNLIETHRFFYSVEKHKKKRNNSHYRYSGRTSVYDVENNLTVFLFHADSRPHRIEHFQNLHGAQVLTSAEEYTWQDGSNLATKTLLNSQGVPLYSRAFSYDPQGNVLVEKLIGNLTGSASEEAYSIEYTYTPNNLPIQKREQDGKVTRYTYLPDTDLIASRLTGTSEKIQLREFFIYDSDNILIETIKDNGSSPLPDDLSNVTQRTIQIIIPRQQAPGLGMPEIIEERYLDMTTGEKKLLKKTIQSYSPTGQITQQEVYDANNVHRYTLTTTYNAMDLPETQTNALGHTTITHYNSFGNPISIEKVEQKQTTLHSYDCSNRLIQTTEKSASGIQRSTYHTYDRKHNRTSTTDPSGNTTHFTYDAFGNNLQTILPPRLDAHGTLQNPIHTKTYDPLNREISSTDPNGHTTETLSTARNKPYLIIHPNGSRENNLYNLNGTLKENVDAEGTKTVYSYDIFEHILSKEIYSSEGELLSKETSIYDAFNLLSTTDAEGNTTYYTYDGAGRKISERICTPSGVEETIYSYDSLGNLHSVQQGELIFFREYDLLNQVIEEREEDHEGNILLRTLYGYDSDGNKSSITRFTSSGTSVQSTQYDCFKRPICTLDPLGYTTFFEYEETYRNAHNQTVLRKITRDPMHVQTIEVYDTHGNIASLEKIDPSGNRLAFEERFYDLAGNLACKRDYICINGHITDTVTTLWQYGPEKKLLSLTEGAGTPEERTTSYSYTSKGLLKTICKPDGILIHHTYDSLDRLITLSSSDNTCHYVYHYNKLHQIQSIEDLTHSYVIYRHYDPKGRLLSEVFPDNITIKNLYNTSGQRTQLILPNQSQVRYSYCGSFLTQIDRQSPSGNLLYTHRYLAYDLSGHLLKQHLINGEEMSFTTDLLERSTSTTSSYFQQSITSYSPVGNVLRVLTQNTSADYQYDFLNQLIEEPSHNYAYDSHYNRIDKDRASYTYNHLHQLVDIFTYNANGAPTSHKDTHYAYDALDRLISIETPSIRYTFTYDPWHRRLSQTLYHRKNNTWRPEPTQYFLYDDQNEIGSYNTHGVLHQLRILGIGKGAEIGAAIALEIDNTLVIPIHDLFGNIVALIDPSSHKSRATYQYTAFGEQKVINTSLNNPWGFSSKRHDPYTELVYFGRRYYDPHFARWLTPDPIGYTIGPNLYVYLLNSPLNKVDLYGLFSREQIADVKAYMRGDYSLSDYHYYNDKFSTSLPNDTRPRGIIVVINGINTEHSTLINRVDYIASSYGVPCHGIYNPTHTLCLDVVKCVAAMSKLGGTNNSTSKSIQEFCTKGSEQVGENGKILIVAHSKGCLDTYLALKGLPANITQKIQVAAFAPAVVLSKNLSSRTMNYASTGFDPIVMKSYRAVVRAVEEGNMVFVPREPKAPLFFDHSYDSPTFTSTKARIFYDFTHSYNCNIPWEN